MAARQVGLKTDSTEEAMKRAMRLLAVRARSCAEIADRLGRAGFEAPAVEAVRRRLIDVGLLDDSDFASQVVRRNIETGKSTELTRRDLLRRGVAVEVVEQSLAGVEPGSDRSRALALAQRRAAACSGLPAAKAVPRVVRHLSSKGYSADVCWEAAREAFRELELEVD